MTEDDARKRWCPFARTYHPETDADGETVAVASVNRARDGDPDPWCLCIASDCMTWRWNISEGEQRQMGAGHLPRHGYCGLAGEDR